MILPWWPVIAVDILGSLAALVLAAAAFHLCRDWSRSGPNDVLRQYLFLLTLALTFFAVSRSAGHLVKQLLLLTGFPEIWQGIAPFSGAVNSAIFVVIFAFGVYFQHFRRIHRELEDHRHRLEAMVEERTAELEAANSRLEEEISERRQIEQSLRDSRATLENVFHAASPICITDLDYNLVRANSAYRDIWPPTEEGHETCYQSRPGSACHTPRCPLERIRNGESAVECEMQKENPDGSYRHFLVSARPFIDANGQLAGIVETFQEITARKRAEEELAGERERLAVTLEAIAEGVIATDTSGRVVLLNRAAAALTGWSPQEALGRPLEEIFRLVAADGETPLPSPAAVVLGGGRPQPPAQHRLLLTRDGSRIPVADVAAPIVAPDRGLVGVVLVCRNLTDELRTERELQRLEKLESLGVLAGGIAHDYNNLLAALLGNLELARRLLGQEGPAAGYLDKARDATLRARDLTSQLLTFAKGGAPVKQAVDLARLVREAAGFVLHGESVALELELADDLLMVEADPTQVTQVIQNLVLNARDAMAGSGTITIRGTNVDLAPDATGPGGPHVHLAISDTGPGMAPEVVERIFEPYFTTKETGTGLGLAIVHSVIRRHHGRISVESQMGAGTTFHLYLPAVDSTTCAAVPSPPAATSGGHRPGHILVMDDEPLVREVTAAMLADLGHRTTTVADGAAAVRAFEEMRDAGTPFDLVIMDLTIPGGMGGREAAAAIRRQAPAARLVVASGYSDDPVLANPQRYGFDAALVKPYLTTDLETVLHRLLG